MTVVAAFLALGVAQTPVGAQVAGAFERAVCTVIQQSGCGATDTAGGPGDSGEPLRPGDDGYNGQTPLEQATSGDYVALGDSYSSGEGAGDYQEGTDDNWSWGFWASDYENMCHRSDNAYSGVLNHNNDFAGDYIFGACSGAVQDDYTDPVEDEKDDRDGEGAQQDHVRNNDPSLVTATFGGNDFGFGNVLGECIKGTCFEDPDDLQAKKDEIYGLIWGVNPDGSDTGQPALVDLWAQMREDAGPDARILIGGYPQLFPDHPTNGSDSFISVEEQAALNELGDYVNNELEYALGQSDANVEYVDLSHALEGHEVGTDDPWIHDLDLGQGGPGPTSSESFHPTAEGQAAFADAFQEQIEQGRP
jgi:lysophospholipase L1-like esterase